jgi:hypothetical protein
MTRSDRSEKVVLEMPDKTGELVYANGMDATVRRRRLARTGVAAGTVDPGCVPFFLLGVGCQS